MPTSTKTKKYFEAVGRRKTAVARVRLSEDKKMSFTINNKTLEEYFTIEKFVQMQNEVFSKSESKKKFLVSAKITGGGKSAQAEALRHGIARALMVYDPEFRKKLKKSGFIKRDPRSKERKKFGLKKARKAPQWSKR